MRFTVTPLGSAGGRTVGQVVGDIVRYLAPRTPNAPSITPAVPGGNGPTSYYADLGTEAGRCSHVSSDEWHVPLLPRAGQDAGTHLHVAELPRASIPGSDVARQYRILSTESARPFRQRPLARAADRLTTYSPRLRRISSGRESPERLSWHDCGRTLVCSGRPLMG